MPLAEQLDLFAAAGVLAADYMPEQERRPPPRADELNDAALISAIPGASLVLRF
jgi:hypothetical protein